MTQLEQELRTMITSIVRAEVERALSEAQDSDAGGYMSVAAIAKLADVAPGTVRRWIREGRLIGHRAGRVLRVRRADLERLLGDGDEEDSEITPEKLAQRDFG
jgi:excisionase family DNA binding protein